MDVSDLQRLRHELSQHTKREVIICEGFISDGMVESLYDLIHMTGEVASLDIVLTSVGGNLAAARRFTLLVHRFADDVRVFVPRVAKSAAAIVALSAQALVLSPLGELGPIDVQLGAATGVPVPPDAPAIVASEDVRLFCEMADQWFGVERPEDRLQVLALLSQRVFPPSITRLYRFDQMVRSIATEALALRRTEGEDRVGDDAIVRFFVESRLSHDYGFVTSDLRSLGIPVRDGTSLENTILWRIDRAARGFLAPHPGSDEQEFTGLLLGRCASYQEARRNFDRGGVRDVMARWERVE